MYLGERPEVEDWSEEEKKVDVTCYSRTNISAARTGSAPGWSDCVLPLLRRI